MEGLLTMLLRVAGIGTSVVGRSRGLARASLSATVYRLQESGDDGALESGEGGAEQRSLTSTQSRSSSHSTPLTRFASWWLVIDTGRATRGGPRGRVCPRTGTGRP